MMLRLIPLIKTEVVDFAYQELASGLEVAKKDYILDGSEPMGNKECVIFVGTWESVEKSTNAGDLPSDWYDELVSLTKSDNSWNEDAYVIIPRGDSFLLAGKSERSVLYAVYTYLRKEIGQIWVFPGESTLIPTQPITHQKLYQPKFSRRGFVFETINEPEYIVRMIDWMAKNLVSEVFFTFMLWEKLKAYVEPEIRKRGISLTLGGHSLKFFFAQDESEVVPQDHPYQSKKQVDFQNQAWVGDVLTKVVSYCENIPNLRRISLWPEDVGIQKDQLAEDMTFLSVYIHFTEQLKEVLSGKRPDIQVEHIAYNAGLSWEMLERGRVSTSCNVDTLFAYWGRNYNLSFLDQNNKHLQRAQSSLLDWREQTEKKGRSLTIFEYYSDHFMLSYLFPMLTKRITKDMDDYTDLGIDNIVNLVVPFTPKKGKAYSPEIDYNWRWVHGCNSFFFARACWDEEYEKILHEYSHVFPQENRSYIQTLLQEIEERVSRLTAWNMPLFPARAVDPEKANTSSTNIDLLLLELKEIQNLSLTEDLDLSHHHVAEMVGYIQQLIEGAGNILKAWKEKGVGTQ